MVELVFANGRLTQGETELARVAVDASLTSGGREHLIVRTKPRGWHYAVSERETARHVCEFEPSRLLRGGDLRSGSSIVRLRGAPLRQREWHFITEAGRRIDARSKPKRSDLFRFEMTLRAEVPIAEIPHAPIVLALGCWLAVHWESAPTGPAESAPAGIVWGPGS